MAPSAAQQRRVIVVEKQRGLFWNVLKQWERAGEVHLLDEYVGKGDEHGESGESYWLRRKGEGRK